MGVVQSYFTPSETMPDTSESKTMLIFNYDDDDDDEYVADLSNPTNEEKLLLFMFRRLIRLTSYSHMKSKSNAMDRYGFMLKYTLALPSTMKSPIRIEKGESFEVMWKTDSAWHYTLAKFDDMDRCFRKHATLDHVAVEYQKLECSFGPTHYGECGYEC